jgi:CHAT domain
VQRLLTLAEAHALRSAVLRFTGARHADTDHLVTMIVLLRADGVSQTEIEETANMNLLQSTMLEARGSAKLRSSTGFFPTPFRWPAAETSTPGEFLRGSLSSSELRFASNFMNSEGSVLSSIGEVAFATSASPLHGTRRPHEREMVLLLGDQDERRLDKEASAIRDIVPNPISNIHVENGAQLHDIRDLLDRLRPRIFHITGHSDDGGLYLTSGEERLIVPWESVIAEMTASVHRPDLVVLNSCHSMRHATAIAAIGVDHVVATDSSGPGGRLHIDCARQFAKEFYSSLNSYDLARSIERANSAVRSRWPESTFQLLSTHERWFAPWNVQKSV